MKDFKRNINTQAIKHKLMYWPIPKLITSFHKKYYKAMKRQGTEMEKIYKST